MDCKFHPTAEAVTTCAICGAGMCSSCDAGAFLRVESGQPLCIECAFKESEENAYFGERYLKRMKLKLIFASIFIILAIPFFILDVNGYIAEPPISLWGVIFWFLSGLIQTWGHEKDKGSIKSIIWDADSAEGSFFGFIIKIIFYAFAAPVMLIRNFIRYPKLKALHQLDIQKYEEIKSTMDNAN